jgi:hypothetical protein
MALRRVLLPALWIAAIDTATALPTFIVTKSVFFRFKSHVDRWVEVEVVAGQVVWLQVVPHNSPGHVVSRDHKGGANRVCAPPARPVHM